MAADRTSTTTSDQVTVRRNRGGSSADEHAEREEHQDKTEKPSEVGAELHGGQGEI
jgi:hypothetical protein